MNQEFLANLWYYVLALVWAIYVSQELFVTGVGMLSLLQDVNTSAFKKLNESVGTFWDGIQVWLIVAIGGLFATFPTAYGLTLQALYIPFFLLLFAIILRGTSIELIYKSDDKQWRRVVSKIWGVSSFVLILVEGVYLTNIFMGLPLEGGLMTESFLTIFSRASLIGGALFVLSALSLGFLWLKLTLGNEIKILRSQVVLWISGLMLFAIALFFLSMTNEARVFEVGLFVDYKIMWLLPIVAIVMFALQFVFQLLKKYVLAFIATILGIILAIFTGFSASFPYILPSTLDFDEGLLIIDAAASEHALKLITIVALVFVPIVIVYQTWKYVKFWRRF